MSEPVNDRTPETAAARVAIREYLRANLFDGDEYGTVSVVLIGHLLDDLVPLVDDLLSEARASAPQPPRGDALREAGWYEPEHYVSERFGWDFWSRSCRACRGMEPSPEMPVGWSRRGHQPDCWFNNALSAPQREGTPLDVLRLLRILDKEASDENTSPSWRKGIGFAAGIVRGLLSERAALASRAAAAPTGEAEK